MKDDPIVEEVHRTRAELLQKFGGDLRRLIAHSEQQAREQGATFVARDAKKTTASNQTLQERRSDAA